MSDAEEFPRRYDPVKAYGDDVDLWWLDREYQDENFIHVHCDDACPPRSEDSPDTPPSHKTQDMGRIILAVNYGRQDYAAQRAPTAWAVFFKAGSALNCAGLSQGPETGERAEITAVLSALIAVEQVRLQKIVEHGTQHELREAVIKTSSLPLYNHLTKNILEWAADPRITGGFPSRYGKLYELAHELIGYLNEDGVGVSFWHVPLAKADAGRVVAETMLNGGAVQGLTMEQLYSCPRWPNIYVSRENPVKVSRV